MSAPIRLGPCLGGLALLAAFAGITTVVDVGSVAGRGLQYVAPGESLFWLAHALLATPGILLLAWGWSPRLEPAVDRLKQRLALSSSTRWRAGAAAYFAVLFLLAAAGRSVVLLDLPITDDENSVAFGGKMMARGQLSVPVIEPDGAFQQLFLYRREGRVSSMDFPGAIAVAALGEATRLGSWLYALWAAGTGLAVAYAATLLAGRRAAVVTALIWLSSPMVATLSMTTHAHLVSRGCVAAAVVFYLRAWRSGRGPDALGFGCTLGLGLLVRPFEVALLVAPLAAHLALRAWRQRALALAAAPIAGAIALFAWYNAQTTGTWWLPARFAPGGMAPAGLADDGWIYGTFLERLGGNVGFNVILLGVFFLGLPGLVLSYAGLRGAGDAGRALLSGLLLVLGLALGHGNVGIHTVGPIHYSECAVPLALLAGLGVLRALQAGRAAAILVGAYLVVALGLFTAVHARSLRTHAETVRLPFAAAERQGIHDAVVVAPQAALLRTVRPDLAPLGGWVYEFPPPDPFLRDDVLWTRADSDLDELRRRFPQRKLYRMGIRREGEPLVFEPLER